MAIKMKTSRKTRSFACASRELERTQAWRQESNRRSTSGEGRCLTWEWSSGRVVADGQQSRKEKGQEQGRGGAGAGRQSYSGGASAASQRRHEQGLALATSTTPSAGQWPWRRVGSAALITSCLRPRWWHAGASVFSWTGVKTGSASLTSDPPPPDPRLRAGPVPPLPRNKEKKKRQYASADCSGRHGRECSGREGREGRVGRAGSAGQGRRRWRRRCPYWHQPGYPCRVSCRGRSTQPAVEGSFGSVSQMEEARPPSVCGSLASSVRSPVTWTRVTYRPQGRPPGTGMCLHACMLPFVPLLRVAQAIWASFA